MSAELEKVKTKYRNDIDKFEAYIKELITPCLFMPESKVKQVVKEDLPDKLRNYLTTIFPEASFANIALDNSLCPKSKFITTIVIDETPVDIVCYAGELI